MEQFLQAHWGVELAALAYIFLAAVSTMPAPGDTRPLNTKLYEWLYDFLKVLSNKVAEKRPLPAAPSPDNK